MAFLIAILSLHTPLTTRAGEPEDFRGRFASFKRNEGAIENKRINGGLNKLLFAALAEYNNRPNQEPNCSRTVLIDKMVDRFDRNWPELLSAIPMRAYPAGSKDAFDSKQSDLAKACWVPTYKVKTAHGEHMMGLDKIDHFFAHGYLMWLMTTRAKSNSSNNLTVALKKNVEQEESMWGLKGPGIKSYGDLSAEYLGLKFWQNLLDGPDPLFVCKDGKYVMKRQFDLFAMIDESVDETVNCNSYADKDLYRENEGGYQALGVKCPVDVDACKRMTEERGPEIAALTLHPLCRGLSHDQIEKPSKLNTKDVLDGISGLISGGGNLVEFWFATAPDVLEKIGGKGRPKNRIDEETIR